MTTIKTENVPYLDGWRGLAIASLLVGHFFPIPGMNLGAFGVNLFFVLSGLLMTRILFIKKVDFPTFYRRRISRIVPSVLVFITAMLIWFGLTGKAINWTQVFAALSFTNNYVQAAPDLHGIPLGHIWSLSVEEHSYVALSLLALLSRKRIVDAGYAVGVSALVMAGCAFAYWGMFSEARLASALRMHSEVAALGVFASAFLTILWRSAKPPAHFLMVPSFVMLSIAASWWSVPAAIKVVVGCSALALAINLLDQSPRWIHAMLEIEPLRKLGTWSFSLYLWQQPFYLMARRGDMHPLVAIGCALATGIAAYYLIENPARLYLNRVWTGNRAGADTGTQAAPLVS